MTTETFPTGVRSACGSPPEGLEETCSRIRRYFRQQPTPRATGWIGYQSLEPDCGRQKSIFPAVRNNWPLPYRSTRPFRFQPP